MIPHFDGADDIRSILELFIPAARKIMLENRLVFGKHDWSITALELYLWTGANWCDPCTDRSPGQARYGTWYINCGPNPNHGRIDIAAGNGNGLFAGLLVRELDRKDGSAIALQKIIRGRFGGRNDHDRWGSKELETIASIDGTDVTTGPLKLTPTKPLGSDVWLGPRVFSTKDPEKKKYLKYPLRVAVWPTEKLKTQMTKWNGTQA